MGLPWRGQCSEQHPATCSLHANSQRRSDIYVHLIVRELWLDKWCRCISKARDRSSCVTCVLQQRGAGAWLPQLAHQFTRFLHLFRICPFREGAASALNLVVRFWVDLCVPPLRLSPSESVSPTLSWSVSFSPVAGMFDGWFTWLLSTQPCPWWDLGLLGVAVLLTKIPIGTSWDLLIGLDQVSNASRQLLE